MPLDYHLAGLVVLVLLLLLIASKLAGVHALVVPDARPASISDVPRMLLRKGWLGMYGAVFLIFSRDKVGKRDLKRAAAAAAAAATGGTVEREVRLIFVRHGESVWNYVFNRSFGPSFLVRLVTVTLRELYLLPWDDSAYIDSPLSGLGLEQCAALQAFLRRPCLDPAAEADFDALTSGEGYSLLVSSQLRRAAATVAIALSDRLHRSKERVVLHSSCQEISRNFDTMALAPAAAVPRLGVPGGGVDSASFDASANAGNKSLGFPGFKRLHDFARWAADRPESTIIIGGHSLWFRSFFQVFLPAGSEHVSTKRKIVNCGVVGLTLQVRRDATGSTTYVIDPKSISVVYGGFATK